MEIERKFLVRRDDTFRSMATSSSTIAQGYMDVRGATVRIRLRDDKAYLTIKSPSYDGGLSRYEFERVIPVEDAREMLKLCRGGLIEKVRFIVPYEGHIWEVDEFHGVNEGLLFAEVELERPDEPVTLPPFVTREVTGNKHYYNRNLLSNPYPNWKDSEAEE